MARLNLCCVLDNRGVEYLWTKLSCQFQSMDSTSGIGIAGWSKGGNELDCKHVRSYKAFGHVKSIKSLSNTPFFFMIEELIHARTCVRILCLPKPPNRPSLVYCRFGLLNESMMLSDLTTEITQQDFTSDYVAA
jgi:hypothetical protein